MSVAIASILSLTISQWDVRSVFLHKGFSLVDVNQNVYVLISSVPIGYIREKNRTNYPRENFFSWQ